MSLLVVLKGIWIRSETVYIAGIKWLFVCRVGQDSYVSSQLRELKQRRRRRQREQQKSKRFRLAKQQLCTHITLFVTFFCRRCTCATWNLPNLMFCRGREHKTKPLFSFPKLCWYRITSVERSVLINRVRFYPELSLEISMYLPVFKGQF